MTTGRSIEVRCTAEAHSDETPPLLGTLLGATVEGMERWGALLVKSANVQQLADGHDIAPMLDEGFSVGESARLLAMLDRTAPRYKFECDCGIAPLTLGPSLRMAPGDTDEQRRKAHRVNKALTKVADSGVSCLPLSALRGIVSNERMS